MCYPSNFPMHSYWRSIIRTNPGCSTRIVDNWRLQCAIQSDAFVVNSLDRTPPLVVVWREGDEVYPVAMETCWLGVGEDDNNIWICIRRSGWWLVDFNCFIIKYNVLRLTSGAVSFAKAQSFIWFQIFSSSISSSNPVLKRARSNFIFLSCTVAFTAITLFLLPLPFRPHHSSRKLSIDSRQLIPQNHRFINNRVCHTHSRRRSHYSHIRLANRDESRHPCQKIPY